MSDVDPVQIRSRIARKLIPFMFVLYIVAYLDRINVGFAALSLNADLGFTDAVYGLGAGIFFIGYFLFEVPSNLILQRVGARRWIARILISWGVVSSSMMLVQGPLSFYGLRFLLGVTEAGFFPGMILYLTYWFRQQDRGRAVAQFMTATAIAGLLGSPISGALLLLDGWGGLAGWQWMFLLEGLPAVILGFVTLRYLPDGPEDAPWLSPAERRWLQDHLQTEAREPAHHRLSDALRSLRLWSMAALYFAIVMSFYGINFWLPQIVSSFGIRSPITNGLIVSIPYLVAAVAMVWIGRHSDRTQERRLHVAVCSAVGAVGLIASAYAPTAAISLVCLSIAALGIWSTLGPFWALSSGFLRGTAAAGGIAVINSVGNLGGFVGPYGVGLIRDRTHSFSSGLWFLAISLVVAALLAFRARTEPKVYPVEKRA